MMVELVSNLLFRVGLQIQYAREDGIIYLSEIIKNALVTASQFN